MQRKLLLVALVVILVGLVGWAANTYYNYAFEKRQVWTSVDFSPDIKRNPYFMAEKLLTRLQIEVAGAVSFNDLPTAPARNDTIFIFAPVHAAMPDKVAHLLEWVAQGGHLVVEGFQTWDEDKATAHNKFFDEFGIQPSRDVLHTDDSEPANNSTDDTPAEPLGTEFEQALDDLVNQISTTVADQLVEVSLSTDADPLTVNFMPLYHLNDSNDEAYWVAQGSAGNQLLQYRYGKGFVTAITTSKMFRNTQLHQHDHALFLYQLTTMDRRDGKAWFNYIANVPSLSTLAWQYARWPCIALCICLFLWVWRHSQRLGPVLPPPSTVRRSIMEHITAIGHWLWHKNAQADLLATARADLFRLLQQKHPIWSQLSSSQQSNFLLEKSSLDAAQVAAILATDVPTRDNEFTVLIRAIQTLRTQL